MGKILLLANNDVGLYRFRKEFIQELIKHKNEVYISLPNGEMVSLLINMGCKYIEAKIDRRGINPIKDLKLFFYYIKVIKRNKPDMVITYTIKPNIYGGLASRFCKVSYAMNITGLGSAFQKQNVFKNLIIKLYKSSCKKVIKVFFENEGNQQVFINNKIICKDKTCILNGAGVNLDEYKLSEYPREKQINFLFIGRIMKEKGVNELFEAAKRIKREYDNVTFDILGPMEEKYEGIVKELSDKKIIKYHGFQRDVKPFIIEAHCFILPSYHEGMANTLLECGAMGRPLITSNVPGCKEAVIDKRSGFLIKAMDEEDLYKKIKTFIDLPYDMKKSMGITSYNYICNNFNKSKVVDITLSELGLNN